jgi:hypothetical protein
MKNYITVIASVAKQSSQKTGLPLRLRHLAMTIVGMGCFCADITYAQELPPECRVLPEHKTREDVAYKPGVDVNGKPVIPADINAAPMEFNETLVVPLSVDLAERLGSQNIEGLDMTGTLGFLEIHPDGRVAYNGRDLTPQIYALCGENPASQSEADAVKSGEVKETTP